MRNAVAAALVFGLAAVSLAPDADAMGRLDLAPAEIAAPIVKVGYYCSPGFEATYGGRCVATISRDEIDLYLNDSPVDNDRPPPRRHHHRRHGLVERY